MSLDIFLQFIATDQKKGIPRQEVRSLFPILEHESETDFWKVRYDAKNSSTIDVTAWPSDPELLTFICVNRPCGDLRLWEALFQILRTASVVLYFPGGPPIVGSREIAACLPEEVIVSLGQPRCVQNGQEILQIVKES